MKTTWEAEYQQQQIKVINTWFRGEKLYINDELQDRKKNFFSSDLKGHLLSNSGEKLEVKANLVANLMSVDCFLFVDDEEVVVRRV